MSLRYKIFGIPKNLDEFIDKVKRKEYSQVDLVLTQQNIFHFIGQPELDWYENRYRVYIKANGCKLKLFKTSLGSLWDPIKGSDIKNVERRIENIVFSLGQNNLIPRIKSTQQSWDQLG